MLSQTIIENVLTAALSTGGDFSEIFVEDRFTNNMTLQSGKIDTCLSGRDFGIGIRVFKGLQSIYAYTSDFSEEGLIKTAKNAAQAIQGKMMIHLSPFVQESFRTSHPVQLMPQEVDKSRKVDIMKNSYTIAKNYHNTISQVTVRYMDEEQNILIANSEGKKVQDKRVRSRLSIQAVAVRNNQMETGTYGPGAHQGFEFFENLNTDYYAQEAGRIAVTMLDASPTPSGKFPVIIDNEFGRVIFHEACGHGLEATSVPKITPCLRIALGIGLHHRLLHILMMEHF